MEVWLPSLVTSAPGGGEWPTACPSRLLLGKDHRCQRGTGGWVGLSLLILLLQVVMLLSEAEAFISGLSECSQTILLAANQIRLQPHTFRSYFVIRSVIRIECFNRLIQSAKPHFPKPDRFIHSAKPHFPKPDRFIHSAKLRFSKPDQPCCSFLAAAPSALR